MDKCKWFGHKYKYVHTPKGKVATRICERCGIEEEWDMRESPFKPNWLLIIRRKEDETK